MRDDPDAPVRWTLTDAIEAARAEEAREERTRPISKGAAMRFEIYPVSTTKAGKAVRRWGWRLVANNNRIVADTSGYDTERNVRRAIQSLQVKSSELAAAPVQQLVEAARGRKRKPVHKTLVRSRKALSEALLQVAEASITPEAGRSLPLATSD